MAGRIDIAGVAGPMVIATGGTFLTLVYSILQRTVCKKRKPGAGKSPKVHQAAGEAEGACTYDVKYKFSDATR